MSGTPFVNQPWHGQYPACSSTGSPLAGGRTAVATFGERARWVLLHTTEAVFVLQAWAVSLARPIQHSTQCTCILVTLIQAWSQKQCPQ